MLPSVQFQGGYPHQERLTFTADGEHLVYVGRSQDGRAFQLYVDGASAGSSYQQFALNPGHGSPSGIVLHPDGSFQTLATRDKAIYRITVRP